MGKDNRKNIRNNGNNPGNAENDNTASKENTINIQSVPKQSENGTNRKKKKSAVASAIGLIILVIVLISAVIGSVTVYQIWEEYTRTTSGEESVIVTIPQGATGADIARILEENGVIKSQLAFRLKLRNSPYKNQLNFGEFELKKNMAYNDIIDTLRRVTFKDGITVTIPEGYSAEMIGALLEEKGLVTKEEFLNELNVGEFEYDFVKDIPDTAGVKYKLQGYLFPSTYIFEKDADAHEIIDILLGEFEKQYYNILGDYQGSMSVNEVVIRASLIEREAKLDNERQTISGVIQNRLNAGMLLQIDAAALYVVTDGMYDVNRAVNADLEVDSPYNTYKYQGLPVGAICNPGIKSIVAAAYPEEHNYFFYKVPKSVTDGSHIFTETYAEHQAIQ